MLKDTERERERERDRDRERERYNANRQTWKQAEICAAREAECLLCRFMMNDNFNLILK